jgi:HEAT repeat protein
VLRAANTLPGDRDEAARRLVQRGTPEARQALVGALSDVGNRQAQLAAARAIQSDPSPDQAYVIPLFAMTSAAQPPLVDAAIQALAGFRNTPDVRNQLIAMAMDKERQVREPTRQSAIRAIGTMPDRNCAQALVALVTAENESPAVRTAAAAALADMTAMPSNQRDPAQWDRWWKAHANLDDATFERELLQARSAQLTRLQGQMSRFVKDTQARLSETYNAVPDAAKEALLLKILGSDEADTRAAGAQLVQEDFKASRVIPPSVRNQLRRMVGDSSAKVRVAVAQALFKLNDEKAFDALQLQLANEPDADVRIALAQALIPMGDVRVVPSLLALLDDPSPTVAEVAARGLGDPADPNNLAPLILKEPGMSSKVSNKLSAVLKNRAAEPGTVSLRAALIDAMGSLKDPNQRVTYKQLLRPNEPVPVRRAVLRALAQLGKPNNEGWPAEMIVPWLSDPDETVRAEAVEAMRTTADFSFAEKLYELIKRGAPDPSPMVRDKAWDVLRILVADEKASPQQLDMFAARFKDDPERQNQILLPLAKRLEAAKNQEAYLAVTRQNIGANLLLLSARAPDADTARQRAIDADKYLLLAYQYYHARDPNDQKMETGELIDKRMSALLAAGDYSAATAFAADCIANNNANQQIVGAALRNAVDKLQQAGKSDEALRLIDAINKMNPALAATFLDVIHRTEQQIRGQSPSPRSAVGSNQDPQGNAR